MRSPEAIRLRDQGVAERQGGRWGEAIRLADLSRLSASQALAIAMEQRDAAAEALLSDRQGWVEGQRPQELVWTDRALNALLIEEEKVRTLSRSTALPGGPAGRRRAGSQQQPAAGGARFARQPTPARDGRPGPDGLPAPASPWPSTPRRRTTAMARSPGSNGISAADGEQVIHVFEAPGVYDVLLTVRDDSGARCGSTSDVARVWVNAPPVAVAGGDRAGFVGGAYDHLLFDASGSRDADGEPLSFLWELGDGVTRSGEKVLHAYAEPGEYAVRLGVADSTGLSCGQTWDEIKVSVQPRQ